MGTHVSNQPSNTIAIATVLLLIGTWLLTRPGSDRVSRRSPDSAGAVTGSMLLPVVPDSFPLCDAAAVRDDYIPCLDNTKAIKKLRTTKQYQHRERHCPDPQEMPRCVVPLPEGYKPHVPWPESRDQIWFNNVPRTSLASYKADQNWLKVDSDRFIFPGGGTQFKYGAATYIAWLEDVLPELAWGRRVQVALDMGCGVASFGAYLDAARVKVLSVAPKDEHEAQVQFALERGVPAMVGVMGTLRQPFPANSFDAVHCARCRVPWYLNGGKLLIELNRLIRPGGYFIWSATPVCLECKAYEPDDREVWAAMEELTARMCWTLRAKRVNSTFGIGVAVWQKPTDNRCYRHRDSDSSLAPLCSLADEADAAWYVPMQPCLHRVPMDRDAQHGAQWPADGAERLTAEPVWLDGAAEAMESRLVKEEEETWEAYKETAGGKGGNAGRSGSGARSGFLFSSSSSSGSGGSGSLEERLQLRLQLQQQRIGGGEDEWDGGRRRVAADGYGYGGFGGFGNDTERWQRVQRTYERRMGFDWSTIRNVMDMDARMGGWGAALAATGKPLWSLNVVPTSRPDTLPIVFERGLLGAYHDWCESFSTYPRTYDLLHADHLLSHLNRNHRRGCDIVDVMLEMDRILRPMGYAIIRETNATAAVVEAAAAALHWDLMDSYKRDTDDTVLAFQKTMWRPVAEAPTEE